MRKCVLVLFGRADDQPEAHVEILLVVLALIWNVRGVVNHDIERRVWEGHFRVVGHDLRPVREVNVEPIDRPLATSPKPSAVHRGI